MLLVIDDVLVDNETSVMTSLIYWHNLLKVLIGELRIYIHVTECAYVLIVCVFF